MPATVFRSRKQPRIERGSREMATCCTLTTFLGAVGSAIDLFLDAKGVSLFRLVATCQEAPRLSHGWALWVITAGVVLVGLLIPAATLWLQRREFQRSERRIDEIAQGFRKSLSHMSAMHWYEQAKLALDTSGWSHCVRYWCYSIDSALLANWPREEEWWEWLIELGENFRDAEYAKESAKEVVHRRARHARALLRPACPGYGRSSSPDGRLARM